ncbi:MAG: peptide chain release factor N(5)-glutamine methyltransferase [Candidatus Omnitrophica bacterium]|nr:peptide chain release factor N(5)-glutamine methyltransferase [Candidatus Omnitrophota bacterium]
MKLKPQISTSDLKFAIEKLFNIDFYDYISGKRNLTASEQESLSRVIREHDKGRPLEYLLKKAVFFGLEFEIDEAVLIPRPETEILVEAVLQYSGGRKELFILDIGTGSANITVALAEKNPFFKFFSVDICAKALALAKRNILKHKCRNVYLVKADLLSCFREKSFDIIVSNPPYVESDYIRKHRMDYEPRIALDGGKDGLDAIRKIIKAARVYLKAKGLLFLEIGYGQRQNTVGYAESCGFELVKVVKDYAGIDRVIVLEEETRNQIENGFGLWEPASI